MTVSRTALARRALEMAEEVREQAGYEDRGPICVYEICRRLEVQVRFVGVSMEGAYLKDNVPKILLSSLRPLPRRAFSCAHELAHHVFGHGSTIDELKEEAEQNVFLPNEFLADCFAGYLLMPKLAVRRAFVLRGWDPQVASAEQVYTIASSLGVGYKTLTTHLACGLRVITAARSEALEKDSLPKIRRTLLGRLSNNPLIVADEHYLSPTIDAEVGTDVLLPAGTICESDALAFVSDLASGRLFSAKKPGIIRAHSPTSAWAAFVRVSRYQYTGLSDYRHLEEEDDDDE